MNNENALQTDENGHRDPAGRFVTGAPAGPGRPAGGGGKQAALRRHLLDSISESDVQKALEAIRAVLDDPAAGPRAKLAAAALLLDRACGKVSDPDLQDLIQQAEALLLKEVGK